MFLNISLRPRSYVCRCKASEVHSPIAQASADAILANSRDEVLQNAGYKVRTFRSRDKACIAPSFINRQLWKASKKLVPVAGLGN
jgi:hypothetical protein